MVAGLTGSPRRSVVKKSVELDATVDAGLNEIARYQFRPQISVINEVLRDYVAATLPGIRRRAAEQRERMEP